MGVGFTAHPHNKGKNPMKRNKVYEDAVRFMGRVVFTETVAMYEDVFPGEPLPPHPELGDAPCGAVERRNPLGSLADPTVVAFVLASADPARVAAQRAAPDWQFLTSTMTPDQRAKFLAACVMEWDVKTAVRHLWNKARGE